MLAINFLSATIDTKALKIIIINCAHPPTVPDYTTTSTFCLSTVLISGARLRYTDTKEF